MNEIFYLAIFGLICGVLAILGGAGWLIWFVIEHVRIV
nr:hypothetical protein RP007_00111 [Rhizobium sp. P007]